MNEVKKYCFKVLVLISLISFSNNSIAQSYQYELDYAFTLPFALTQYSPKTKTAVGPMKFDYPTTLDFSINPKIILAPRHKVGVYFAFDEYLYGYARGLQERYCKMLKFGLSYEYILFHSKKFEVSTALFLNIGRPLHEDWDDIIQNQYWNHNDRNNHIGSLPNRIATIKGTDLNINSSFLPSIQLKSAYNISPRTSISLGCTYQQGFKNIATTYTSIESTYYKESALYTARFDGTALFMNIGISFKLLEKF